MGKYCRALPHQCGGIYTPGTKMEKIDWWGDYGMRDPKEIETEWTGKGSSFQPGMDDPVVITFQFSGGYYEPIPDNQLAGSLPPDVVGEMYTGAGSVFNSTGWDNQPANPERLSGFIVGASGKGGTGVHGVAGAEALTMIKDGKPETRYYGYSGPGVGAGSSFSGYVGVVFNLDDFDSYTGEYYNFSLDVQPIAITFFASPDTFTPSGGSYGFTVGQGVLYDVSASYVNFQYIP